MARPAYKALYLEERRARTIAEHDRQSAQARCRLLEDALAEQFDYGSLMRRLHKLDAALEKDVDMVLTTPEYLVLLTGWSTQTQAPIDRVGGFSVVRYKQRAIYELKPEV